MTEENNQELLEEICKEAGIPTKDDFMGLVMSTESNGLDEARMEKAFQDWRDYYSDHDYTNFGFTLCHLINKADLVNLHRISKGFPEHIRIFAEKNLLADVSEEKKAEVLGANE